MIFLGGGEVKLIIFTDGGYPPPFPENSAKIINLIFATFPERPLKNYVILLGGGGEVTKRIHKITRGGGGVHQKITSDYRGGGGQFGQTIAKAKNQRNPEF